MQIKIIIPANLTAQEAKKIADEAWKTYSAKYPAANPSLKWNAPDKAAISFQIGSSTIAGTMAIQKGQLLLDCAVPFAFRVMIPQATKAIQESVDEWVRKSRGA